MHFKNKLFLLCISAIMFLMTLSPAAGHPRVVLGEAPDGWAPQGPGWFISPDRSDLLDFPASSGEWRTVYDWIDGCVEIGRVRTSMVDPLDVLAVLRLEDHLGVPWEARGILASVWCMEASMLTHGRKGGPIRGDYKNGIARAHGPAQLWPWFRSWCGFGPRGADNLYGALTCYWSRVVDRYHARNVEKCDNPWAVAEALAANGPRYLQSGCRAESSHWRQMIRWRS
jgi:hypothetical protein